MSSGSRTCTLVHQVPIDDHPYLYMRRPLNKSFFFSVKAKSPKTLECQSLNNIGLGGEYSFLGGSFPSEDFYFIFFHFLSLERSRTRPPVSQALPLYAGLPYYDRYPYKLRPSPTFHRSLFLIFHALLQFACRGEKEDTRLACRLFNPSPDLFVID